MRSCAAGLSHVPGWCAIVAFGGIVVSLAMTAHEKDFVDYVEVCFVIEGFHHFGELLPLGCVASIHARVRLINQAKVDGSL